MIKYVCVASSFAVKDGKLTSGFLQVLAELHVEEPESVFISPSAQNYVVLPYMPPETGVDYATWERRCEQLMAVCDMFVVIMSPGWEDSIGVRKELEFAARAKIPVEFLSV